MKPRYVKGGMTGIERDYQNGVLRQTIEYGYDPSRGFDSQKTQFDSAGHQVRLEYFGRDGRPTLDPAQEIAGWYSEYADGVHETKQEYFGLDGKPTRRKGGSIGRETVYENGKLARRRTYGYDPSRGYDTEL